MHPDAKRCEACGYTGTPREVYAVKGWPILRCERCGLRWTDARGLDAASIYTEEYFQGGVPDGYFDYLGSERLLRDEYEARLALIRRHCRSGRLLEVGCATGGFLEIARKAFEVQGLDVSEFAANEARRKGLDVSCGTLLDSATLDLDPPCDVIALFDTIEHLPEPAATLERAQARLSPGGTLVLSTGDAESPLARITGKRWRLMTPPQHLWFFGKKSLTTLLERLGFEVLAVEYPWRKVPISLAWYQLFRGAVGSLPDALGRLVLPVNLFDTMTVIARRL